jgi:hypothetical protein
VASLDADAADRFVMQPGVWVGETRLVGPLAAADLGRALALADLAAGQEGWKATAMVGQSLGDAEGTPLFPPDEASKDGATEVQADLVAAWRCAALEDGALTGALQGAPASAVAWLTRAAGWCDGGAIEQLRASLCDAWKNAPETDLWCGRPPDESKARGPAEGGDGMGTGVEGGGAGGIGGGVVGGVTTGSGVWAVHHAEITWKQIEHFFLHYKDLEPGKWVKLLGWGDAREAQRLILEAVERAKVK